MFWLECPQNGLTEFPEIKFFDFVPKSFNLDRLCEKRSHSIPKIKYQSRSHSETHWIPSFLGMLNFRAVYLNHVTSQEWRPRMYRCVNPAAYNTMRRHNYHHNYHHKWRHSVWKTHFWGGCPKNDLSGTPKYRK